MEEQQLVFLLANNQKPDAVIRKQAEMELMQLRTKPAYLPSLTKIAIHDSVSTGVRQSALSNLRQFIENNWTVAYRDGEPTIPIPDDMRALLKQSLLDLALGQEDNRKVKVAASHAIGKIAIHDFPEQWPSLLPALLNIIPTGTDAQLHGALRVLGDLVEESLSEDQFFSMAPDIVKTLTEVALDENRKPMLRALAISIFRSCFDLMNIVKDEHAAEVTAFAQKLLAQWNPFFISALERPFPKIDSSERGLPNTWYHMGALKLQVLKTLMSIRKIFPNLLLPQITVFFSIVWEDLINLQGPYEQLYIKSQAQGRLEDADNLPYTLDFLILEELDFLIHCFRSPPVKAVLDGQLQAYASGQDVPWMWEMMRMLVSYARVTQEEEELWDIDCSLYLTEQTAANANYSPRSAAGDLLVKLGEWFNEKTIDALFAFTSTLFSGNESGWQSQEAALFLFTLLLSDFHDLNKTIPDVIASACLELVEFAINKSDATLIRARGFIAAGTIGRIYQTPPALLDRMIHAITNDESEVVQVACIKAIEALIGPGRVCCSERQVSIIRGIEFYMHHKDSCDLETSDELLVVLAETLRAAIRMDTMIVLRDDISTTDLLLTIVKLDPNNFQVNVIVTEALEEIFVSLPDRESFAKICGRMLPTLTGALDVINATEDNPLVTISTELLAVLTENASEPLPEGFVAAVLPKLNRLLMGSNEGEVLRPGSEAVRWILSHDHQQVLNWQDDDGSSGLEVCLRIVDRLLCPSIEDNWASQVGGLAVEIVEKAGQERLGPFLPQLLQAVAQRLASAKAAAFIQSLILVFARLSLYGAHDVVEFLSQIHINGESGLQVVISKWLENSVNFAGYDEIRQNVIALSKLYKLNDARVAQINVKGDLIIAADDGKIKTRSRAKENPDQYEIIPAPLKIIKVLVEELGSASGEGAAASAAAAMAAAADFDDESEADGWEDDDDALDLTLAAAKMDLTSYMEGGPARRADDELHSYLTEFFVQCGRENEADFQKWYNMLSEDEQARLNRVAESASQ